MLKILVNLGEFMNIYEVAKRAGVSIATVSRIINNKGNVSFKTRDHVLRIMKELDYEPNAFARALGLNSNKTIGVLCSDVSDIYYAKAVSVIEDELRKIDYDVILYCTGFDFNDKVKAMSAMLARRVDAIILIGSIFQEPLDNNHIQKAAQHIPIIIINGEFDFSNTYSVKCDDFNAIKYTVKTLYDSGHKNILYVYNSKTSSGVAKKKGFIAGIKSVGINPFSKNIFKCEADLYSTKILIDKIISSKNVFSAIITANDMLAVGIIKGLSITA